MTEQKGRLMFNANWILHQQRQGREEAEARLAGQKATTASVKPRSRSAANSQSLESPTDDQNPVVNLSASDVTVIIDLMNHRFDGFQNRINGFRSGLDTTFSHSPHPSDGTSHSRNMATRGFGARRHVFFLSQRDAAMLSGALLASGFKSSIWAKHPRS